VPKSRVRKKKVYTPPAELRPTATTGVKRAKPSPQWVPGLAIGLIVAGIAWLVTYYMSQGDYPVASLTLGAPTSSVRLMLATPNRGRVIHRSAPNRGSNLWILWITRRNSQRRGRKPVDNLPSCATS
jgi:hypothetical protein